MSYFQTICINKNIVKVLLIFLPGWFSITHNFVVLYIIFYCTNFLVLIIFFWESFVSIITISSWLELQSYKSRYIIIFQSTFYLSFSIGNIKNRKSKISFCYTKKKRFHVIFRNEMKKVSTEVIFRSGTTTKRQENSFTLF